MNKVLIITYYWPPSGGSGVQRWMYFAKYLSLYGYKPYVITVDEQYASYPNTDSNLLKHVEHVTVYKTKTFEPLKLYSYLTSGDSKSGIPQGGVNNKENSPLKTIANFIRGNCFIPDARKNWSKFAFKKAKEIIEQEDIHNVITTGPPHSSHLVGLKLKSKLNIKWIADLRDPWSNVYFINDLHRMSWAQEYDKRLEYNVLKKSDINLTVGIRLKELLKNLYPDINEEKFRHIYNGFDSEIMDSIKPVKSNHFELTFIGLLTESQPYDSVIKAVRLTLNSIPNARLKICLAGRISDRIKTHFREKLPEIEIIDKGYVTHKTALQLMHNSNCLFNCLAIMENDDILISGKQMEYVSTGNPILCFGNTKGESAMILNRLKHSCMVDQSEIKQASNFIINLYNNWLNDTPIYNNVDDPFITSKSRKATTQQLSLLLDELSNLD